MAKISPSEILEREGKLLPVLSTQFSARGGNSKTVVEFKCDSKSKEWKQAGTFGHIDIPHRAHVYTICHAGENRSQVARLVMEDISRANGKEQKIHHTHGVKGGTDPYMMASSVRATEDGRLGDDVDFLLYFCYDFKPVSRESYYSAQLGVERASLRECEAD